MLVVFSIKYCIPKEETKDMGTHYGMLEYMYKIHAIMFNKKKQITQPYIYY